MLVDSDTGFLGRGWRFPLQLDPSGAFALAEGEEDIREAIRLILETGLRERVMRPEFGGGLHQLVFEPMSAATIALARHQIETALVSWEPRVDEITVLARPLPEQGVLELTVRYRVRSTNTFYNLVYPFYLLEGGGP